MEVGIEDDLLFHFFFCEFEVNHLNFHGCIPLKPVPSAALTCINSRSSGGGFGISGAPFGTN